LLLRPRTHHSCHVPSLSNNTLLSIDGVVVLCQFNLLSGLQVPAENYPFCTIKPSTATVPVPDARYEHLKSTWKPKSQIQAVLTVTDIAGLVKGASEGKGLGNEFLSNIQAVDAIYHVTRGFLVCPHCNQYPSEAFAS
jgi:obg-like ATPase 1